MTSVQEPNPDSQARAVEIVVAALEGDFDLVPCAVAVLREFVRGLRRATVELRASLEATAATEVRS